MSLGTIPSVESREIDLAASNQKYWDLGLQSFNAGDNVITAIQTIWDAMSPPASLPLVATIVGTLWADTFWAATKFDSTLLAANLQAALMLTDPQECQKAASIAFQKWYGLLVRANMNDEGYIPKADPVTASPDVVIDGQATHSVKQLITTWNNYIYNPGLKNNAYGRVQSVNIHVPIKKPVMRMYYSDAGLNPPPTSWIKMITVKGSETSPLEGITSGTQIGVGERAAPPDAFAFNIQGSGHYCVIAVAGSEYFTNNPSDTLTQGNWNTQEWIHCNGAAGWHNMDVLKSNEATLKYYNQDGVPERFIFEAHCRNLPKGTIISLESEHRNLVHSIKSPEVKITKAYQVVSTEAELPPNFAGDLKVRFRTPDGELLPKEASIDVRMDWHIPNTHRHYSQAIEQLGDIHAFSQNQTVRIPMGSFIFMGANK